MPTLLAFASLPFGVRGGTYEIKIGTETIVAHVTDQQFNPFLTVTSRPELMQALPHDGAGEGFTTYTWYDHPFVLRVAFGRNVAALGSLNSCATILQPLPDTVDPHDEATLSAIRQPFAQMALVALNTLIAVVRRRARLYHVFDLKREDIDITVRDDEGSILSDDPLQASLAAQEEAETERFDLHENSDDWYSELAEVLMREESVSLADDLLIEAERALVRRFPRQAIATCHTAMETSVSTLLTHGMAKRGLSDKEIDHLLATKSLTAKLDLLLRRYAGFSLKRDNHSLWKTFNQLNDLRNDTVHRGSVPSTEDAEFALGVTRDLLRWLDMVRSRNQVKAG